jgi:hypothetical protein
MRRWVGLAVSAMLVVMGACAVEPVWDDDLRDAIDERAEDMGKADTFRSVCLNTSGRCCRRGDGIPRSAALPALEPEIAEHQLHRVERLARTRAWPA